ncbi:TIGR02588 family protein [Hansschlegelia zhihuaiae]|uniref:TIGR02588 family protein n=1 Tax=Hansschlegelia zhihuaiae TaxID=405005 RepID=A0A4V1KJ50_9HYPH|nr:TIGR02588 family protein [Hansschlegelia zhihuaiae]RXF72962.1 TIGR02588 family protein [Hansschlegelia zhihuaiae]
MAKQSDDKTEGPPPRQVGRLEWVVAALGAALVAGVFGMLLHEALTYEDGPPVIVATVLDVHRTEGGHVVRFTAENRGHTTAAEVTVLGRLTEGDRTLEQAEITLDYIARKSSREAGLVFQRDPASAKLELKATSYRKP